jgi:hypothetical protein
MIKTVDEGPKLESFSASSDSVTQGFIYVELGETNGKSESFKWHQEFNKQYDSIYLLFNDPSSITPPIDFNFKIQVKKSQSLESLKTQICQLFENLTIENLIIKKVN